MPSEYGYVTGGGELQGQCTSIPANVTFSMGKTMVLTRGHSGEGED